MIWPRAFCLPKLPTHDQVADDDKGLSDWMRFLTAQSEEELKLVAEKNPKVAKAVVRLMELSDDERVRLLQDSRDKMQWDIYEMRQTAKEEGYAEGHAEGKKEMVYEIARNALKRNVAESEISILTGLSVAELKKISEGD